MTTWDTLTGQRLNTFDFGRKDWPINFYPSASRNGYSTPAYWGIMGDHNHAVIAINAMGDVRLTSGTITISDRNLVGGVGWTASGHPVVLTCQIAGNENLSKD